MSESKYKVGDKLAYRSGWDKHWRITVIDRVTPTGLLRVDGGKTLLTSNLRVRGGSDYYRATYSEITPEIAISIRRGDALRKLAAIKLEELPPATLEGILDLIEACK